MAVRLAPRKKGNQISLDLHWITTSLSPETSFGKIESEDER